MQPTIISPSYPDQTDVDLLDAWMIGMIREGIMSQRERARLKPLADKAAATNNRELFADILDELTEIEDGFPAPNPGARASDYFEG